MSSKAVPLLVSLIILVAMACGTAILLRYRHVRQQEAQRLMAISRLGLDNQTTWAEVEYYLDCELVTLGMERSQLEVNLALLGKYEKKAAIDPDNGRMWIIFEEYSLAHRYYYFKDGLLIGRHKIVGGLDGPVKIDCSTKEK